VNDLENIGKEKISLLRQKNMTENIQYEDCANGIHRTVFIHFFHFPIGSEIDFLCN
jgi:hypothetical protein